MDGFLTFLGGLSLFLFGMQSVSHSLQSVAGARMERALSRLCSTPLRGVLFGALVTAALQSSSATTVMVVGFVNAGLMPLSGAVGVVMGANLGTTATAWLLSLAGEGSTAPLLTLLRPSTLAPVLLAVGVALMLFDKKEKRYEMALVLVGFGVLFLGLEVMQDAVAPLAQREELRSIIGALENPLAGILAGALVTAIIQSSSASVGILQGLTVTGAIGLRLAVPVIMGQNIGTCVTALLSGLGTGANARRASFLHLYFNLAGTVLFLPLFLALEGVGIFGNDALGAADIALVHTVFNLATTLVLLPFSRVLLSLAIRTVPEDDGERPRRRLFKNR